MVVLQPVFRPPSRDYGYPGHPGVHFMIALVISVFYFVSSPIITVRAACTGFCCFESAQLRGQVDTEMWPVPYLTSGVPSFCNCSI